MSRSYKDAAVIIKQAGALVFNMSAVVGQFQLVSYLFWRKYSNLKPYIVYLAEVNEITHLEVAQYSIEQFLSDVGGAAGLFMGMSLATVLGTFDCVSMMVYEGVILVSYNFSTE